MMRITDTVKHLIIINVILWFATYVLGQRGIDIYTVTALHFPENPNFGIWQPITSMFMHSMASPTHLLFNMLGLWMFGSALEARWGKIKFLSFYMITGVGAGLVYTLVNYYDVHTAHNILLDSGFSVTQINELFQSSYEGFLAKLNSYANAGVLSEAQAVYDYGNSFYSNAVGASGALYGILVAFGMLYPNVELMLLFLPIPIKAKYFIPGLLLLDFIGGITGGMSLFGAGNIAHFAHLGGALFGFLLMLYFKKTQFNKNRWD
ncbi:membrane associated rhomboid family serine protease [Kordia periserrulae]|uniref:Membrane associated rhomboid family serine protease n=1 Tax=Kordia periserrulae TaxID=701523 RepID=A0A2T6C0W5_9FLAO|nr:rhomboid family intramembrane serine protease [Kordia periserrulae]PTX61959.1 membrane associated rhomboid family serine protease [Kordia periserrulae]